MKTTSAEFIDDFKGNKPRLIEGSELYGWHGLEGTGYITDVGDEYSVVVDITADDVTMSWYVFGESINDDWGWITLSETQKSDLRSATLLIPEVK